MPVLPDFRVRELCWDSPSIVSLVCLDYVLPVDDYLWLSLPDGCPSILFTWASHSSLLTWVHLNISWILLSCWSWSLWIFVSKYLPMDRPYYLHLCGSEKLLGIGCFCSFLMHMLTQGARWFYNAYITFRSHTFIMQYKIIETAGYTSCFRCLYPHLLLVKSSPVHPRTSKMVTTTIPNVLMINFIHNIQ